MSITCGFYNSVNHDRRYNATQMSSIFNGIINDGVFMNIGNQMMVSANEGMIVNVGIGRAWFDGTWTVNDALYPLTVSDAHSVLDRIDAVVLEVNMSEKVRDNTIKMVVGTPSSTPIKPELTNTEFVHQHALAYISVAGGTTTITQANITNNVGTDECPFVTGILETISATELIKQWEAEFSEWMTGEASEFDTWSSAQKAAFVEWSTNQISSVETWLQGLHDILDSETATHLQLEIEALQEGLKNATGAKEITQDAYDELSEERKKDGTLWVITDADPTPNIPASVVKYNSETSGLESGDVQAAIDEVANKAGNLSRCLTWKTLVNQVPSTEAHEWVLPTDWKELEVRIGHANDKNYCELRVVNLEIPSDETQFRRGGYFYDSNNRMYIGISFNKTLISVSEFNYINQGILKDEYSTTIYYR